LLIGGRPMVDNPKSRKTTRIAEEELNRGLLEYDAPHLNAQSGEIDKEEKKRK
jgi:DNA-directed RNA polymerase subunit K/omega